MKGTLKVVIFYVILIGVLLIAITTILSGQKNDTYSYDQIVQLFKSEQVKECYVGNDNVIYIKTHSDKQITYEIRDISIFYNDLSETILKQVEDGVIEKYDYEPIQKTPWWLSFLPYIIVMVLFVVLWIFVMNQATGRGGK